MKLKRIEITNIKAIGPEGLSVDLEEDMVMAIGPNGVGKSSILEALRVFFGIEFPSVRWFHGYRNNPFYAAEVAVTFYALTEEDKAHPGVSETWYTDEDEEEVWRVSQRFYQDETEGNAREIFVGAEGDEKPADKEQKANIQTVFDADHMQWIYVPAGEAVCEGATSPFSRMFQMFRMWDKERSIADIAHQLNAHLEEMMGISEVLSHHAFHESLEEMTLLPEVDENLFLNPFYQSRGVQRAVFFALLREYGEVVPYHLKAAGVQNMVLIEDPEMYMDPQMERYVSETLFALAEKAEVQVVSTTHSAVFVRALEKPQSLARLYKDPEGTLVCVQVKDDVFEHKDQDEEQEHRLRAVREFSPDVSALFFAHRVVLVEGATEIAVLQRAARLLGVFDYGVSLINCHGGSNIPMFQEVLNHFGIRYKVVHDLEGMRPNEGLNQHILNLLGGEESRRLYHDPHMDDLLGIQDSPKWFEGYKIVEQLHQDNSLQEKLGDLVAFVYGE